MHKQPEQAKATGLIEIFFGVLGLSALLIGLLTSVVLMIGMAFFGEWLFSPPLSEYIPWALGICISSFFIFFAIADLGPKSRSKEKAR